MKDINLKVGPASLCSLVVEQPYVKYLASWSFNFLTYKIGCKNIRKPACNILGVLTS